MEVRVRPSRCGLSRVDERRAPGDEGESWREGAFRKLNVRFASPELRRGEAVGVEEGPVGFLKFS